MKIDGPGNVTTTSGHLFSHADHCVMAALIYARFGYDKESAAEAWRRLMENDTPVLDFLELAVPGGNLIRGFRKLWND